MTEVVTEVMSEENNEEQKTPLTKKEAIEKMVDILTAMDAYNEALKQVKDDCKESGLDAVLLTAVAKAIVNDKLDDLKIRSENLLEIIDEANL